MEVKIENLINVWYDQIPTLFINLVNAIVLARDEKELREVIDHFHKNTSLKGMFAYGREEKNDYTDLLPFNWKG